MTDPTPSGLITAPDIYYLDHALVLARELAVPHRFELEEIERVLGVWEQIDGHLSTFGYDILLKESRRRYLQYTLDEADDQATEEIVIEPLAIDGARESIGSVPHWSDAHHINEALGLGRRQ